MPKRFNIKYLDKDVQVEDLESDQNEPALSEDEAKVQAAQKAKRKADPDSDEFWDNVPV